ncbi:hypothetical protein EDB89DRAFT_1917353, partial [Lactarius sanguifluus]
STGAYNVLSGLQPSTFSLLDISEHRPPMLICKRVFKTPGAPTHGFREHPCLNTKDFETLSLRLPGFVLKKVARPKTTFERPSARARQARRPTNPPAQKGGGVSKRMGVGVDTSWGFELELATSFPDPAPAHDDASYKCGREERDPETSSSRHRVVYGPVVAWPLSASLTLPLEPNMYPAIVEQDNVPISLQRWMQGRPNLKLCKEAT